MVFAKTTLFTISEILFPVSKLATPSFKLKLFIMVIYILAQDLIINGILERIIRSKKGTSKKKGTEKPYYSSEIQ